MKYSLTFSVFFLLLTQYCLSNVWEVPGYCPTIQAGLDSCQTGDTVLVASGTYYENLFWPATQGICLISESGAALTSIDGGGTSNVISIVSGVSNTTIIDGFTIKNGYAGAGGGIGIRYSSPTIKNNTITQNIAFETPANLGGGGGIAVGYNSSPIIVYNTFTYNSATASGGGGFLCGFNSHPVIDNNTFENNSAATGGGAILIHNDCSATITNNLIKYNNSNIHGGGIYFQQANSTVQNNKIEYNTADRSGGGIGAGWPDISLVDNNIIRYNLAHEGGGGIALLQDAMSTLSNNDIYNNIADSTGGGIFCHDNSNGQILNNILKHNEAKYGGGIHCYTYSNPVITGNTIDSNKAFISGGGIRCKSYSSPQIIGNTITYNVAEDSSAGGISCIEYSSPEIWYNNIRHNKAELSGGGIVCYDNSSPSIKYDSIENNSVPSGIGGGLFCGENSSPDIIGNVFNGNSSSVLGADIFAWWGCTVIIDSNQIHGSQQSSNSIYLVGTSSFVRYNSITNHEGSGIGLWSDHSNISYNIIAHNDSGGVVCDVGSNPIINFNDIIISEGYGVNNRDPVVTVNAENNWWGDASGPSGAGPGTGSPVSLYVDYDPWLTQSVYPDTLLVPSMYATIQEAIHASIDGNVVLVAEGTYYENINFKGKAITVASHFIVDGNESHIENTIIDGSQPSNPDSASVVSFKSGEDTNSVLCGFTITGGTGSFRSATNTRAGGGIVVYVSGAKICNNIVEFNSVNNTGYNARGGGIFVGASYTTIINNNIIRNNSINGTYPFGGGIEISFSGITYILSNKIIDNETIGTYASGGGIDVFYPGGEVVINGNYIKGNDAQVNGWGGGGIDLYNWEALITVSNNLIVDNSARWGGGILVEHYLETSPKSRDQKLPDNFVQEIPFIVNNTIINNFGDVVGGIYGRGFTPYVMNSIVWGNTYNSGGQIGGTATVRYSDVEGGFPGEGNIDTDPSFSDTLFHLENWSMCIGAGIESIDIGGTMYYCPPFCYYGNPRPNPSGSNPDIGACESPLADPVGVEKDVLLIPEEYSLEQNYPNPFNPTTKIKYSIPQTSTVTLKVFDILGNEIETLVSEEKSVGRYDVIFNAATLPSGIYFYRLQAGSFVETKKMVLMK